MINIASLLAEVDQEVLARFGEINFVVGDKRLDMECPDQEVFHLVLKVWHELWITSSPPTFIHCPISKGSIAHWLTGEAIRKAGEQRVQEQSMYLTPLTPSVSYDN